MTRPDSEMANGQAPMANKCPSPNVQSPSALLRAHDARAEALIRDHPYATVACCGLTFKANVDDLRESPAMEIALHLAANYGPRIKIVEPNLRRLPAELADHQVGFITIDEALRTCEIAILLVDHDEFKMIPLSERRHLDVIDTRGIWQDMPMRI